MARYAPPQEHIMGALESLHLSPGQASRILIPPFKAKFSQSSVIGNISTKGLDTSEWEAQFQYLSDNPPDYGLVTNFPPNSWDSACFLWPGVREMLLGFGQEHLGDYKKENNYRIEEVGPEGKGVVAARDFEVGDLIMLERPAILKPLVTLGFGGAEIVKLIDRLLARLPEDIRNGYLTLSSCMPELELLLGVMCTNGIKVTFPGNDVIGYHAVAIDLSRCNHRCKLLLLDFSFDG
jgi:hypothetical protein